jgi:hypothetical protein
MVFPDATFQPNQLRSAPPFGGEFLKYAVRHPFGGIGGASPTGECGDEVYRAEQL